VVVLKISMRSSSRAEKIGEEMALKILVERKHALKFILTKFSNFYEQPRRTWVIHESKLAADARHSA